MYEGISRQITDKMDPQISRLIYKQLLGTLTDRERAELDRWAAADEANASLARKLTDLGYLGSERARRRAISLRRPYADMQRRVNLMKARRVAMLAGYAAALCGILWWTASLFTTGSLSTAPARPSTPVLAHSISIDSIRPGVTKARLVTPQGVRVQLDSLASKAGRIDILPPTSSPAVSEELCLEVPRGGEFRVVLSDSTVVWLNSESQLRFPETFDGSERRVSLTGEAYFEVHTDTLRPFYVESAGQVVRVYGTRFDIKAYADEETSYTTLESGSISLCQTSGKGGEIFLSPGQQAVYDHDNCQVEMKEVKTSVITGWRHGRFVFEGQTLDNIMRDLSRWYDFQYEFADPSLKTDIYLGSIPRYSDFRTAIAILEKCGDISVTTADNRIVISKK
ncbi:FecR family protein [Muribaculaceae bacterium Isolate-110 (HZI)]|nr:FecR family protein [Muribaculaceae bacterium Isolate-110 (HZI)]